MQNLDGNARAVESGDYGRAEKISLELQGPACIDLLFTPFLNANEGEITKKRRGV